MRLGIIGLPQPGKSTIFEALTKDVAGPEFKAEDRIATLNVPETRVDRLNDLYKLPKTIYVQVEYFLPGVKSGNAGDPKLGSAVRDCDALIHVVRNHTGFGFEHKTPYQDFIKLDQDLILSDLMVAEKRRERIEQDHKRGKKMNPEEHSLLTDCIRHLENETPLRTYAQLASAPLLRGYAFASARPMLVLFNNGDDDDRLPQVEALLKKERCLVIRGKLEQELSQMPADEAAAFRAEFNISDSALNRVIRESYALLDLISFFTIGKNEIRAWAIRAGTRACDAAEVIHTDMKRGFIRAEVVCFDDLMDCGSYSAARKNGTVRLEGKSYEVQDGDIIQFRFNV
jgi:GTP-binding protein YchF